MAAVTKEQWQAIKSCDKQYDGSFFYGLTTTKKVCRPSCPKRSYDPKRIVIFSSVDEAQAMGYRPCARCRPELPDWAGAKAELARAAERLIRERSAEKFSLAALAAALHVDKSYLLRTFKCVTGSTPLEYHNRVRCEAARELLTRPELSVSYIASEVGYVSASHFSRIFRKLFGCTPTEYRDRYLNSLND